MRSVTRKNQGCEENNFSELLWFA